MLSKKMAEPNKYECWTRTSDTDMQILYELDGEDLYNVYIVSKYICNLFNKNFWFNKFFQMYNVNLGSYNEINYWKLYRKLHGKDDIEVFLFASKKGFIPLMSEMMKRGVSVNVEYGRALELAAKHEKIPAISFLIEKGIGKNLCSLLVDMVKSNRLNVIEFLFNSRIIDEFFNELFNLATWNYLLEIAIKNGRLRVMKYLINCITKRYGVNILTTILHQDEWSKKLHLFYTACEYGDVPILKVLIDTVLQYEDLAIINRIIHQHNDFVLLCAIAKGNVGVVSYLLFYKANPHVDNNFPLRTAINKFQKEKSPAYLQIIATLVEYVSQQEGENAVLDYAKSIGRFPLEVDLIFDKYMGNVIHTVNECIAKNKKGMKCQTKTVKGKKYCVTHLK